jgi:HEAT repeat protein
MEISQQIDSLNSADVALRRGAAERLATAPAAAAAVSLVRASGDDDEQVRQWAVAALEELGAPDAGDVAALAELLSDSRADVRYWSATLLGRLGAAAAAALEALVRVLDADHDPAPRQRAAWAIGNLGRAALAAQRPLQLAAQSEDARLAREALAKLESI